MKFWNVRGKGDTIARMNGFIDRLHPWLVAMVSMLTWITILSFFLSYLFDAGISGGWIIAGALISIASFAGLLLTKDLTEAILSPEFTSLGDKVAIWKRTGRPQKKARAMPDMAEGLQIHPSPSDSRRIMLGLCDREISASNRRRSRRSRNQGLWA